jgi:5-methyltetrahydrofolate--homocysteine methyltransferase
MGTTLNSWGLHRGPFLEEVNLTHPDQVTDVHRLYLEAGSAIIYACTFGANGLKAAKSRHTVAQVVRAAVENARAACLSKPGSKVALDIGSLGELLEPYGELGAERAGALFREIAEAGAGADMTVIETVSDLNEALIALEAVKSVSDKPVFVTMTFAAAGAH